jgi:SAM-dependent methyltransferase
MGTMRRDAAALEESVVGRGILRGLAAVMESPARYWLCPPSRVLEGAGIASGMTVLEVGCGTGYFTLPAARQLGSGGHLVAIDILEGSVELVSGKVKAAGLTNVHVVRGDALRTSFPPRMFDAVLLFGVIPAPMLPVGAIVREMCRVLKPDGRLAVWPHVPFWLPRSVLRTGGLRFTGRRRGVDTFDRC